MMISEDNIIYLDNCATAKTYPEVYDIMKNVPCGNPSSLHSAGCDAARILEDSRKRIANCIGAEPEEIYFTSGGTESDNLAIMGAVSPGDNIVTTSFEHKAVLNTCKYLENHGCTVTYVNPNKDGFVDETVISSSLKPSTRLVSVMYANNELGTIQNIGSIIRGLGDDILFHTDAVQAVGKVKIDVKLHGIDMLSASAHKFGGPKGVGFLYISKRVRLNPILFGGMQENGLRPGTENVAGAAGMAYALERSLNENKVLNMSVIRNLLSTINGLHMNVDYDFSTDKYLYGVLNFSVDGVDGQDLTALLSEHGVCVSAGAACNSGTSKPSYVLKSIGLDDKRAKESIRISAGNDCQYSDIVKFYRILDECISMLRG